MALLPHAALCCAVLCLAPSPHKKQDDNAIVRTFGSPRTEEKLYNHVDLVQLLVRQDTQRSRTVSQSV